MRAGSLRAGCTRPQPSDTITLATDDAGDASAAARSYVPAAASQGSADTLMRARRMSASNAIQPQHAGRAAGSRLDAPLPTRDHGASREAWRRSGRSRRGEGLLPSPPVRRTPPCWHMPYMKGAGGDDASRMGCNPGGISAPNGVAWTWVPSPAVSECALQLYFAF